MVLFFKKEKSYLQLDKTQEILVFRILYYKLCFAKTKQKYTHVLFIYFIFLEFKLYCFRCRPRHPVPRGHEELRLPLVEEDDRPGAILAEGENKFVAGGAERDI